MSEVNLSIGGRRYTVACADGEEAHIITLGESIDAKMQQMNTLTAQDSQNMLFAALLIADELHDLKVAAPAPSSDPAPLTDDSDLAFALERFAQLLENCADKLEAKAISV